jgi:tripartite-type tricarboxylate transporter receptor subunit TctC
LISKRNSRQPQTERDHRAITASPKGTPREIISRLNAAAVEALADPAVRLRFSDLGLGIFPRERQTPEALGALQRSDAEKWWPPIKEFGIKAE